MTYDEMIKILQAAKAGKVIEYRDYTNEWKAWTHVRFNFANYNYRVKPEPKRCWVKFGADGKPIPGAVCDLGVDDWTEMVEVVR